MPCSIRSLQWALIGSVLALGVGLLAQAPVPVTVGWSDDPTFAGSVSWTVQRTDTGVSVPCGQVQPGATWRCTALLPMGTYPIRLRGTRTNTAPPLVGAWSASVTATIGSAPGALVLVHAEAFKPPHMGFTSEKTFTTDASQAGTADSSNFPILIKVTDNDLKTVGNGGYVQQSDGSDILAFSDVGLTTQLPSEKVFYDGTAGTLWAWVRASTLSHTTNLVSYLGFGNASPPARTGGVFSAYAGVWHFGDGTTLSSLNSATGSSGTITGATAASTAQTGAAAVFGAGGTDIIATDLSLYTPTVLTSVEAWINIAGTPNAAPRILDIDGGRGQLFISTGLGEIEWLNTWSGGQGTWGATSPSSSTWHHILLTYDATSAANVAKLYYDGVLQTLTTSLNSSGTYDQTAKPVALGNRSTTSTRAFDGSLAELRLSAAILSSSWDTASYNSQKAGSTFLTWGSRTPFGFGALLGGQRDHLARGF